jgi:hypothetical protein
LDCRNWTSDLMLSTYPSSLMFILGAGASVQHRRD